MLGVERTNAHLRSPGQKARNFDKVKSAAASGLCCLCSFPARVTSFGVFQITAGGNRSMRETHAELENVSERRPLSGHRAVRDEECL